ncbi:MAG: 2-phosphosulfolactate phosphatase [Chloroflexi bacterium]|nr:2-phosphosulfolactate phosphatase [Chloroflexota bacterium]
MEIDVSFTPRELARLEVRRRIVVVIDVVRASTTIVQGLASGGAAFVPVGSVAAARRASGSVPEALRLLGGERGGVRIPGFDLGNSPWEYTPDRVAGKTVVFTTTNGTAAIRAARDPQELLIGALVNLEAVARYLAARATDVVLAAAGQEGRPVLDDTVCAGLLAERLQALSGEGYALSDGARLALGASQPYRGRLREMLEHAASGRALLRIGYQRDLDFCAQLSVLDAVPGVVDGRVVLLEGAG